MDRRADRGTRFEWLVRAIILTVFAAPLTMVGYWLWQAASLKDRGLRAEGVVVTAVQGSSHDSTPYCVEYVEYKDAKGKVHRARRSCSGHPEDNGTKVTVYYAPDAPDRAYVEDDNRVGEIVFAFGVLALFVIVPIMKNLLTQGPGSPPDEVRERFRNRSRREGSPIL